MSTLPFTLSPLDGHPDGMLLRAIEQAHASDDAAHLARR